MSGHGWKCIRIHYPRAFEADTPVRSDPAAGQLVSSFVNHDVKRALGSLRWVGGREETAVGVECARTQCVRVPGAGKGGGGGEDCLGARQR